MSNVVDFKKPLQERRDYLERKEQVDASLIKRSEVVIKFYKDMQEKVGSDIPDARTLSHIFHILHTSFTIEVFKRECLLFAGAFAPSAIYEGAYQETSLLCLRLSNANLTPDVPLNSITSFALGTKEGIKKEFDFDIDMRIIGGVEKTSITDEKEARTIIYDYVYDHSDVDTPRDTCVAALPAYTAMAELVKVGYVVTDYGHYVKRYSQSKRNVTSELVVEFVHPDPSQYIEKMYLYFDYEATLRIVEVMLDDIFGANNEEPKKE
jgi:hypothetical protein